MLVLQSEVFCSILSLSMLLTVHDFVLLSTQLSKVLTSSFSSFSSSSLLLSSNNDVNENDENKEDALTVVGTTVSLAFSLLQQIAHTEQQTLWTNSFKIYPPLQASLPQKEKGTHTSNSSLSSSSSSNSSSTSNSNSTSSKGNSSSTSMPLSYYPQHCSLPVPTVLEHYTHYQINHWKNNQKNNQMMAKTMNNGSTNNSNTKQQQHRAGRTKEIVADMHVCGARVCYINARELAGMNQRNVHPQQQHQQHQQHQHPLSAIIEKCDQHNLFLVVENLGTSKHTAHTTSSSSAYSTKSSSGSGVNAMHESLRNTLPWEKDNLLSKFLKNDKSRKYGPRESTNVRKRYKNKDSKNLTQLPPTQHETTTINQTFIIITDPPPLQSVSFSHSLVCSTFFCCFIWYVTFIFFLFDSHATNLARLAHLAHLTHLAHLAHLAHRVRTFALMPWGRCVL